MEFSLRTLVVMVAILIAVVIILGMVMGWLGGVSVTWESFTKWTQGIATGKVQP